jgi:hypothetical protein
MPADGKLEMTSTVSANLRPTFRGTIGIHVSDTSSLRPSPEQEKRYKANFKVCTS